ncbi:MAG: sulfotransferase domain-containing protein [Verrucomicrobia bacterium]|nr:sulfotransferase domain-containing protein [Verrucomicrobiota bacterium]
MSPESYHFGTRLAVRCDYYAFPRTGSHYLWACFTGLFDLVFYPNAFVDNPEAKQRADELNPHAFYVLRLRDDGVPYQPVYINAAPQGVHGAPASGEWPVITLIRDPHPTIYSWFHTATERWGANFPDRVAWMREAYQQYRNFYDAALAQVEKDPARSLLIRFEELKQDPAVLAALVKFVGVQPKLSPAFVHWWTAFERMTKPGGKRTFYRAGNNAQWRSDAGWQADLAKVHPGDFSRYGYPGTT